MDSRFFFLEETTALKLAAQPSAYNSFSERS